MKIIDLINDLVDGKEVPKKIKYQGDIYLYNKDDNVYEALEYCQTLLGNVYECDLKDEIEILEEVEDKEYEELEELKIDYDDGDIALDGVYLTSNHSEILANKINALIRNQKKILERLDKNEVI